jgi:hypothetical protein
MIWFSASAGERPRREGGRQLSAVAAWALGMLFVVVGVAVIFAAWRVGPSGSSQDDPPWLAAMAGAIFVLLGAAVINGFAIAGGASADGDLLPGTPLVVRAIQYLLGLGIVGLLTTLFGWVAFAPGQRTFRVSGLPIPGLAANETTGRIAFGVGAVLLGAFFVVLAVVGARRLLRARSLRADD